MYLRHVLICKSRVAVSRKINIAPPLKTYISDALWISLESNELFWVDDRHILG